MLHLFLIGILQIHYFSTESESFVRKSSDYYDPKDFPKDLTDAFSWPPQDGSKYSVYLIKEDQYCLLTDQQKVWRSFEDHCSDITSFH